MTENKVKQKSLPREDREKLQKRQRDKDREKVKGIFKFYEVPGGELSFCLRLHKGDEVEKYTFNDGKIYTVPLGVAKHLNKSGVYPVHAYAQDEGGQVSMKVGKKVRRYGFQSLEFVDVEEFDHEPSPIITVEKA